jgi:hypothetical protein
MAHDAGTTYLPRLPHSDPALRSYHVPDPFDSTAVQFAVDATTSSLAKNQEDGGFSSLFNCGTRALDFRVVYSDNFDDFARNQGDAGTFVRSNNGLTYNDSHLLFRHGDVIVPKLVKEGVREIVDWADNNPNELILVLMRTDIACRSDRKLDDTFAGSPCWSSTYKIFDDFGVPIVTGQNARLDWTVNDAMQKATNSMGRPGKVLVLWDVPETGLAKIHSHYDSNQICNEWSFFQPMPVVRTTVCNPIFRFFFGWLDGVCTVTETVSTFDDSFSCHVGGNRRHVPHKTMEDNMMTAMRDTPEHSAQLITVEAHWQQNEESVKAGISRNLMFAGPIKDEQLSGINLINAERLANASPWDGLHVNLVQVDNVCNGGLELKAAIENRLKTACSNHGVYDGNLKKCRCDQGFYGQKCSVHGRNASCYFAQILRSWGPAYAPYANGYQRFCDGKDEDHMREVFTRLYGRRRLASSVEVEQESEEETTSGPTTMMEALISTPPEVLNKLQKSLEAQAEAEMEAAGKVETVEDATTNTIRIGILEDAITQVQYARSQQSGGGDDRDTSSSSSLWAERLALPLACGLLFVLLCGIAVWLRRRAKTQLVVEENVNEIKNDDTAASAV